MRMRWMWQSVILLSILSSFCTASDWGYGKNDDWGDLDGECDGKFQSPVDLIDVCDKKNNKSVIVDPSLRLVFINYDQELKGETLILRNNGHTAQISVKGGDKLDNRLPQLSGSAVGFNKFQLQQIHFHWNRNGSHSGSEHSLYGQKHAFEMHLVHFNTKYDAPGDAGDHPDGSTVLSILFDYYDCGEDEDGMGAKCAENTMENQALAPITKLLREVDDPEEETPLSEPLNLRSLLPHDTKTFFWYQGSLTTPPCAEDLTWIVFPEIQNISKRQLKSFEFNFKNDEGKLLGTTNRGLQPLNGRLLLISRDDHCRGESAVPADQESDDFAESTNIDIGAKQTVSDFGKGEDDSKDDGGKDGKSRGKGEKSDDNESDKDKDKGKESDARHENRDDVDGDKKDGKDSKDEKKKGKSSQDQKSKDSDDDEKGDKSDNDSSKSKGSDDKKKDSSDSSGDGKNKDSNSPSSRDSNSRKSDQQRSRRGTGAPSGAPTGDPPGDARGANGARDNGGVLSNAAGVDRPYGLYGDKPSGKRSVRQIGHPAGPPTGNPAGGPTTA